MLLLSVHARHGCYLMQGHYTCLGTKETLSEMLGMMDKSPSTRMKEHDERNRRKSTGPGHPAPEDVNNSSSPATEVLQGPDIRPLPQARTSGTSPEIRRPSQNAPEAERFSPDIRPEARTSGSSRAAGHPAPSPDIRHLPVRRDRAKGPCIPPLTYPFVG